MPTLDPDPSLNVPPPVAPADGGDASAGADAAQFRVMQLLAQQPTLSQRDLAKELGLSLGKVNYCVRALVDRGWVKANNFRRSDRKIAYAYVLTPAGLAHKLAMTRRFLAIKEAEYEQLSSTIKQLKSELGI